MLAIVAAVVRNFPERGETSRRDFAFGRQEGAGETGIGPGGFQAHAGLHGEWGEGEGAAAVEGELDGEGVRAGRNVVDVGGGGKIGMQAGAEAVDLGAGRERERLAVPGEFQGFACAS